MTLLTRSICPQIYRGPPAVGNREDGGATIYRARVRPCGMLMDVHVATRLFGQSLMGQASHLYDVP